MTLDDVIITGDYREQANWDVGLFVLLLSDILYASSEDVYSSKLVMWCGKKHGQRDRVFFETDNRFDLDNYAKACGQLLKPGRRGEPECVVTLCAFRQQLNLIRALSGQGFAYWVHLPFMKNNSGKSLKTGQRYSDAAEYAVVSSRDRLPLWSIPREPNRLHPMQKSRLPVEELIHLLPAPGKRVCDLTCRSGMACAMAKYLGCRYMGFAIDFAFAKTASRRCVDLVDFDDIEETI